MKKNFLTVIFAVVLTALVGICGFAQTQPSQWDGWEVPTLTTLEEGGQVSIFGDRAGTQNLGYQVLIGGVAATGRFGTETSNERPAQALAFLPGQGTVGSTISLYANRGGVKVAEFELQVNESQAQWRLVKLHPLAQVETWVVWTFHETVRLGDGVKPYEQLTVSFPGGITSVGLETGAAINGWPPNATIHVMAAKK